jgi:hypothetical protein
MYWNATCGARTVPKFGATLTSGAIWSHCGRRRFQPAIRRQRGGRVNGELDEYVRTCRRIRRDELESAVWDETVLMLT